jgi:phage repressor protein C with HTH and peptisase S24 domain
MEPRLYTGDLIFVLKFFKLKEGKLVVAKHNDSFKIKRIHKIEDDKIFLKGDNEHPNKDMSITKSEIVGRVFTLPKLFRS